MSTSSSAATSCGKIVFVPWPISVDAVRMRIRPSRGELEARDRAHLLLARAGEPGAVPGEREADRRARCGRPAVRVAARGGGLRPGPLELATPRRPARAPRVPATSTPEHLPGRGHAARPVDVPAAELERRHPERIGRPVDLHLGGELGLRRPEARGTRRWAACWSRRRATGSGRCRRRTGRRRGSSPARARPGSASCRRRRRGRGRCPGATIRPSRVSPVRWWMTAGWRLVVADRSSWRS